MVVLCEKKKVLWDGFNQILNLRRIVEGFVSVKNYRKLSNSVNTKIV